MPVPLFDTATPLEPLRAQIDAAIGAVVDYTRVAKERAREVLAQTGGRL